MRVALTMAKLISVSGIGALKSDKNRNITDKSLPQRGCGRENVSFVADRVVV